MSSHQLILFMLLVVLALAGCASHPAAAPTAVPAVWSPDLQNGTYKNPIIYADYSDPDVIRVGSDFYLVASSFTSIPALPILHSKDLVNWTIIGHVFDHYPYPQFDTPEPHNGVWAPSIRYHKGEFYVYYGDPDIGVFMSKTKNPAGPWGPLTLVREAKGWIDTCPFWDDDGNAYLVHAFANSRAGIKSKLAINRMSPDGTKLLDDGQIVFDGTEHHPTMEGPKLYKRHGYYYIFTPAGGVTKGWQTVLRSKNIYGPYEDRIVMDQGNTEINGPHQGGWVDTPNGENWFIHFQDRGGYGRITHLQPMTWINDWPMIGEDPDGDGKGQPVLVHEKPNVGKTYPAQVPQTSDEFNAATLGLQWQWNANFKPEWYSLSARPGFLRLSAVPLPENAPNLLKVPSILLQKLPAPDFTATAKLDLSHLAEGEKAGLIILGREYSFIGIERTASGWRVIKSTGQEKGGETLEDSADWANPIVYLRVTVHPEAVCHFSYSADGKAFKELGEPLTALAGGWVGARMGVFCLAHQSQQSSGYVDFDYFRVE